MSYNPTPLANRPWWQRLAVVGALLGLAILLAWLLAESVSWAFALDRAPLTLP